MDNIQGSETVVPEGQTTPETQVPEVQSDGATSQGQEAPQGTTFQELAAKKGWTNPDELAKAYSELESHSTKTSQEKADYEKLLFSQTQESPTSQPSTEDVALQELDKFVNERISKEVKTIRAEFQDKEQRRELRDVMDKNPDFGKYVTDVKNLKSQYPTMSFNDALMFAKAQKGDLAKEATTKAFQQKTETVNKQMAAQASVPKQGRESNVGVSDALRGAGQRWAPKTWGHPDSRAVSEIEQIEKELFGRVLQKTNSGL